MTVADLTAAFEVYFDAMDRAVKEKCYWSLLHMLLVMPDVCASLQMPKTHSGDRYVGWCRDYMPSNGTVSPGDRYQMRNAVLHEGTTIPDNTKTSVREKHANYRCFSFVDPENFSVPIHQTVNTGGDILTIDVAELEKETRAAMLKWFGALQRDTVGMAEVTRNLPKLAKRKPKVAEIQTPNAPGKVFTVAHRGLTTSSS